MDKATLKIVDRSGDTPEFPRDKYIINPDEEMMVSVPREYWKVDGDILREMTQAEKDELEYATNTRIYFLSSGTLSPPLNGNDWDPEDSTIIINPVIPDIGLEYSKPIAGELVPMNTDERAQYDYTHKSEVYIISKKEIIRGVDATPYENDIDAIIGAVIPDMIEARFTEVINNKVVAMPQESIDAIKTAEAEAKAIEDAAKENEISEKERCKNIADRIKLKYTPADERAFNRKLNTGEMTLNNLEIVEWLAYVNESKALYPKV